MTEFIVRPVHESDWSGIHTAEVFQIGGKPTNEPMSVIHCKAGPGCEHPSVKAGQSYSYRGMFPAILASTAAGFPVFSVHELAPA